MAFTIPRLNIVVDPRKAIAGLKRLQGAMGNLQSKVFSLQGAFLALGGGLALNEIKQATLGMERMSIAMRASAGSIAGAADDIAFLEQQTKRLSLGFMATSGAYQKFRAAASSSNLTLGEQREIFMGVAEAAAALRLSDSDTEGALRAIEQMVSKGKVSAEELRQQLGERLPGAVLLASQAMGMSERDFNKLLESGKIMAEDMLPKLAVALRSKYGKAALEAGKTASAAFTRADNSMLEFKNNLGSGGIVSAMAAIKEAIAGGLAESTRGINGLGEGFMEFARSTILFAGAMFDTFKPVIAVIAVIGKAIMNTIEAFMEGFAALPTIVRQMGLFGAIFLGPMGRLVFIGVTTAMGLIDEFMAVLGQMSAKLGEWAEKVANVLPEGWGKETAANIAEGLKGFGANQANRVAQGQSYEQELAAYFNEGNGNPETLTGKGIAFDPLGALTDSLTGGMGSGADWAARVVETMNGTYRTIEDNATVTGEKAGENLGGAMTEKLGDIEAGLKGYFDDLELNAITMGDVVGNAFKGMEDALTDFVATGKMDFKGLVDAMIADLARLMVQQYLMLPLKAALGFANGGVMTANGPLQLQTYSRGGIANSPQLALYGEGRRPEAYVPLPDGRTIPVTMRGGGGGNAVNTTINVNVEGGAGGGPEGDKVLAQTIANVIDKKIGERLQTAVSNGGMLNPKGFGAGVV